MSDVWNEIFPNEDKCWKFKIRLFYIHRFFQSVINKFQYISKMWWNYDVVSAVICQLLTVWCVTRTLSVASVWYPLTQRSEDEHFSSYTLQDTSKTFKIMFQGNTQRDFDYQFQNAICMMKCTNVFDINASIYEHVNQYLR